MNTAANRFSSLLFLTLLTLPAVAQDQSAQGGTVHGLVVDTLGRPIVGASVEAFDDPQHQRRIGKIRTGKNGYYRFGFPAGRPYVRIEADGMAAAQLRPYSNELLYQTELLAAGDLVLQVVDEDGEVLVGAHVAIEHYGLGAPARDWTREAKTDARGIARFAAVPLGSIEWTAFAPGHGMQSGEVWLREGGTKQVAVSKSSLGDLEIGIANYEHESGTPAQLQLEYSWPGKKYRKVLLPEVLARRTFDEQGKLRMHGIPQRQLEFRLWQPNCQGLGRTVTPEQFGTEIEVDPYRFRLQRFEGRVTGTGYLVGEEVVARSRLAGMKTVAKLDADGRFVVDLDPGRSELLSFRLRSRRRVFDKASRDGSVDLKVGDELKFEAVLGGMFRTRVLDHEGRPVANEAFQLRWVHPGRTGKIDPSMTQVRSDHEGRVRIDGLSPRLTEIYLDSDRKLGRSEVVTLVPGEEVVLPDFRLDPPAVIRGRVLDDERKPVAGVHMSVSVGNDWASATTDRSGRFLIRTGIEGEVELGSAARWQNPAAAKLELKKGGNYEVELVGTHKWSEQHR